jgi:hypothetical protein
VMDWVSKNGPISPCLHRQMLFDNVDFRLYILDVDYV